VGCVRPKLYPIKIIAAEFVHFIYMYHVETAKGRWLAANVGYNCPYGLSGKFSGTVYTSHFSYDTL
jgi:hypothetical protein